MNDQRLVNFASILLILFLTVYALIVGRFLLLPFVVAILIWYLTVSFTEAIQNIPFWRWHLPYPIALFSSLVVTFALIYTVVMITSHSFTGILQDIPKYQAQVQIIIDSLEEWSGATIKTKQLLADINFTNIISIVMSSLTSLAGNVMIIVIYVLFLLIEYKTFPAKLRAISKNENQYRQIKDTLDKVNNDVKVYLQIKTIVSLATGFISYVVLLGFGVRNAAFWGILIFLLNYIPTIGSIIAIFMTLLAVSIQFTTWWSLAMFTVVLVLIQIIMGNIVEPRFMSKHLNLSPLVILLALGFWGSIWGVIGMFLCIPAMTIINIMLSKFERTRPISIMLSA